MFFLFMLLVLGTLVFFLVRHGQFGPQSLAGSRSPESEAKKILAERFARGDITSDEFMERFLGRREGQEEALLTGPPGLVSLSEGYSSTVRR